MGIKWEQNPKEKVPEFFGVGMEDAMISSDCVQADARKRNLTKEKL